MADSTLRLSRTEQAKELRLPAGMLEDVDKVLATCDEATIGVLNKWRAVEVELIKYQYQSIVPNVRVSTVLVSKDNRSKLMLNPRGAHQRGANIKLIGVSISELEQHAIAFEMPPVGKPERDEEIIKNMKLVTSAGGLLAPVNGNERLLSVGSSHATAFFRAGFHGCPTPEPTLQDKDGRIDIQTWAEQQPAVETIRTQGFSWRVVRWEVPMMWPKLPDLASRAFNGDQAVAQGRCELEVCAGIAAVAEECGGEVEWKDIVSRATSVPAACNAYASVLGTYARLYADGDGAPLLFELENQIKKHAPTRILGEEMWKSITYANFGKYRPLPEVRGAMIGAALTAPKIRNGVVATMTTTDVSKLTSKNMVSNVDKVVEMMRECRNLIGDTPSPCALDLYYQLTWRLILHVVGKGKYGFEAAEFPSLEACCRKFVEGCNGDELKLNVVLPEAWSECEKRDEVPAAEHPDTNKNTNSLISTADQMSPAWVVSQQGFIVGAVLTHMVSKTVWKVMKQSDCGTMFTLQKCVPYGDAPLTETLVKDVADHYRPYTGSLQNVIDSAWVNTVTSASRDIAKVDLMRSRIYSALLVLESEVESEYNNLLPLDNPRGLRAAKKCAVGILTLVPSVPLRSITTTKPTSPMAVCIGELLQPPVVKKPYSFYVSPTTVVPKPCNDDTWACPFFWVETVSVEADANMRTSIVQHTIDGVTLDLPVLRNFRRVDKFDKIAVYVPQVKKDMSEPAPIKVAGRTASAGSNGGAGKGQRGTAAGASPQVKKDMSEPTPIGVAGGTASAGSNGGAGRGQRGTAEGASPQRKKQRASGTH